MNPLFVPVTSEVFEDYKVRGKEWEIRHHYGRYQKKQVICGRKAEIRKGYSGPNIKKIITGEYYVGSLEDIFSRIPLKKAEPTAKTIEAAIMSNRLLIVNGPPYIAFRLVSSAKDIKTHK